jgi:two-component system sensor histidine kinase QseC
MINSPSIRTFLLINLLLSIILITSLAIIGNLFLAHKDIEIQLDNQLIDTSLKLKSLLSLANKKADFLTIQQDINQEPEAPSNQQSHIAFQVWNANGLLILHSKNAPDIPFSNGKSGISSLLFQHHHWQVHTRYDPKSKMTIMVSQQSNYRKRLENQLTQDSILIMIITYPFLGLLIWIIIGRGLSIFKKIAYELSHRQSSNLSSLKPQTTPSEIMPLVNELNRLFDRLKKSFEREKRFTADAAHELKTPLAALSAQTQVALRANNDIERVTALNKVLSGVKRSSHAVQQLLTLNKAMATGKQVDFEPVNLAAQVREMAALLAPSAIERHIELTLETPDAAAMIYGSPASIEILLRNILDNAIRYTQVEGSITIHIESTHHVTLHVIDNGPGIPDTLKERVFERFFRVIGNEATGTGLGLGIVQQIAALHGADITLKDAEAVTGLHFIVSFPALSKSHLNKPHHRDQ